MTPEYLSSIAGVILSILASYLPVFSSWFDALSPNLKRLLMLGLLALASIGCYALACLGLAESFAIPLVCSEAGAVELFKAFLAAVIANQAAYMLSPKSATRQAKAVEFPR